MFIYFQPECDISEDLRFTTQVQYIHKMADRLVKHSESSYKGCMNHAVENYYESTWRNYVLHEGICSLGNNSAKKRPIQIV